MMWYEEQKKWDRESHSDSEQLLGVELDSFVHSMSMIAKCMDAVADSGVIREMEVARKLSFTNYAFNLLWSAWANAMNGRLDIATSSWRSTDEAPEFLMAFHANPQLATDVGFSQVKVSTARRAVRDALEAAQPGKGKEWFRRREQNAKDLQAFSHISVKVVDMALGIRLDNGKKVAVMRPGGIVGSLTLRPIAASITAAASELLVIVVTVFRDRTPAIATWWDNQGLDQNRKHMAKLADELSAMPRVSGQVTRIDYVRVYAKQSQSSSNGVRA